MKKALIIIGVLVALGWGVQSILPQSDVEPLSKEAWDVQVHEEYEQIKRANYDADMVLFS